MEVLRKSIKHVHLSVYPPLGAVKMSAPERMPVDTLRAYAISRLPWIRQQQRKIREQERETPREYLDRESHYVWGRRYLLKVLEKDAPPVVTRKQSNLLLQLRPGSGVEVSKCFVQHMKTRWGSCNPVAHTIRLNTELAKKPKECLEYIVVHEMAHILEPSHNARFVALMDRFMPDWQHRRDRLNRLPVRHEDWVY